jgi:hypothetical protein
VTDETAPPGVVEGRVEHIASGRATRFRSVDELVEFMRRTLSSVEERERKPG